MNGRRSMGCQALAECSVEVKKEVKKEELEEGGSPPPQQRSGALQRLPLTPGLHQEKRGAKRAGSIQDRNRGKQTQSGRRAEGDNPDEIVVIDDSSEEEPPERKTGLHDILHKLQLTKHLNQKLGLKDVLEITPENIANADPQKLAELPKSFLRKLLAVSGAARSPSLSAGPPDGGQGDAEEGGSIDISIFCSRQKDTEASLHPLDLLCAVLACSDTFLQQETLAKMSMCQFALPLVLPAFGSPRGTFLLWATRAIVKQWRPQCLTESRGFQEESLALASVHTISIVRMGTCSLSKSGILNEVLSPSQQHHDYFIHWDAEAGDSPRNISYGLIEMAWYFPGSMGIAEHFSEPLAVANLRGDALSYWPEFCLLAEVSSAVFIFTEGFGKLAYSMLSSLKELETKYYFVLTGKGNEALEFLNMLSPKLKLNQSHLLVKDSGTNKAEFVKKLRSTVSGVVSSSLKRASLEGMACSAHELGFKVEEDNEACQSARRGAQGILEEIRDVSGYKKEALRLQGDLWGDVAKTEKELCRMKRQQDKPSEVYRSQLKKTLLDLRRRQYKCGLTIGMVKFISGIRELPTAEKHYFLKWMKFGLDSLARGHLSRLLEEYRKESTSTAGGDAQKLSELSKLISDSSLGVEHFMREMGQAYEAECSMVQQRKVTQRQRKFLQLPALAAELMLGGVPIELIDGDVSNIPLQWVTDVLMELHNQVGGKSRVLVIAVLGVQSTGKSTLLNTMFGLQFAVSSGRCTRGAFMSLVLVGESFREELGCEFLLVIDTEGLKAPELATLEDSYEHDNELATLVVGLSDVTLINLAMENAVEMRDVLQIAVHAFLRMGQVGLRPSCHFVHQNVGDISAHEKNVGDRKRLLEQLNEMTRAAAKMEKLGKEVAFSDIMDYDPEKNNWYIPGLWHGVPPMAAVSRGYSEKVSELKMYLFEMMKEHSRTRPPKDVPQLLEWVKSLWKAVKHENFLFSFRNSLVAEAYRQLSVKFSELDWEFRKEMQLWVFRAETYVQNQALNVLGPNTFEKLKQEAQQKLDEGEQKVLQDLQSYFESGAKGLHLVEKYREDFVHSGRCLRNQLESSSLGKCEEAIRIQKSKSKIDSLRSSYMKTIERQVDKLVEDCRGKVGKLSAEELEEEFGKMWCEALAELPLTGFCCRSIPEEMHFQLRKDLGSRGSLVSQLLSGAESLLAYADKDFKMKRTYLDLSWTGKLIDVCQQECYCRMEAEAESLFVRCRSFVEERVQAGGDYSDTYCGELLRKINKALERPQVQKIHPSACFEAELKLHILGEAALAFQTMHESFVKDNDAQQRLENLRPQYLYTFKDLYFQKDVCQDKAQDFCHQCLKPALVEYVNRCLGLQIADDLLSRGSSVEYSDRSLFHFVVQKKLLEQMRFQEYVNYLGNYRSFVKSWIRKHLSAHYEQTGGLTDLGKQCLSSVLKKIKDVLDSLQVKEDLTVDSFLGHFCCALQRELVLPREKLDLVVFGNLGNASSFTAYIEVFLPQLEKAIHSEWKKLSVAERLFKIHIKPEEEIFKRVFGCGQQCPFCKVPCEAGGTDHKEHFATLHRPQGLGQYRDIFSRKLVYSLCSSDVASLTASFKNLDTAWKPWYYNNYRYYYPNWRIQPDLTASASAYWKYVFAKFNSSFAKTYAALPAELPRDWLQLTKVQALWSIQEAFNIKQNTFRDSQTKRGMKRTSCSQSRP